MVKPFGSPVSSPKKSSRKSKDDHKINPFSYSGLDKFSALLAEHEEQRRKIYSKIDPKDAPIVRFVYKNSNQCVPLLIKTSKDSKTPHGGSGDAEGEKLEQDCCKDKSVILESRFSAELKRSDYNEFKEEMKRLKPCKILKTKANLQHKLKRPGCYLPVTVILILVFLAVFGRSVAILCTSIGWYVVSVIKGQRSDGENLRKKNKDFVKKLKYESPKVRDVAAFREKFLQSR